MKYVLLLIALLYCIDGVVRADQASHNAACLTMAQVAVRAHNQLNEGVPVMRLLVSVEDTYADEDKVLVDAIKQAVSWAAYYEANDAGLLQTHYYRACLKNSDGPFNMSTPGK